MNKRVCVAIAVCLFLASFAFPAFYVDGAEKDAWASPIALFCVIPLGESGNEATITEYKAGYWIWLSSIIFLAVVVIIHGLQDTPSKKPISS